MASPDLSENNKQYTTKGKSFNCFPLFMVHLSKRLLYDE